MHVSPSGPTVYFDVDNTLVYSQAEFPHAVGPIVMIGDRAWVVEENHVEAIRDFAARGHSIIVWSAGGSDWSKLVVESLGLNELVFACLSKPTWYFDDVASEKFMPTNIQYYKGQVISGS